MTKPEQIIKKKGREQFYSYYTGLGYDPKTAAALALFTYGRYDIKEFSIDAFYDALCKGEAYPAPEEPEEYAEEVWEEPAESPPPPESWITDGAEKPEPSPVPYSMPTDDDWLTEL